jgi:recombinational DNA repair protein RecT
VFELHEGEVEHFDKHTRDVRYKTTPITTEQQYLEAQKKKIVGWVARYEMADGSLIEKMYWEVDLHKYNVKYSSGYRSFLKDGTGIWATNMYEMKKKAVFLKSWREYLPKTEKLVQALKEVSRLNNASFETLELNAKPIYYDNPTSSAKELSVTGEVIENKPKARVLAPLEKPASKEALSELFRFIKENYEDDQKKKEIQKAIWGVALKISNAKGLSFKN